MEGRPRKTGRRQASAANGATLKVDQRVRTLQMIEANKKYKIVILFGMTFQHGSSRKQDCVSMMSKS